jgi:tetratricopeptide (TPR) repeat protein
MEHFDSAIVHFRKAIILNPKNAVAYYYLATSYARNKKDEEALLYLQQAFERGYNSYEYIIVDPDLETIRKYSAYKTLMKKFFPKKYKPEDDQ